MEENRRNPRCTINWRCAVVVDSYGRQETIQSRTNDISISGVSVICHRNIPPPHPVTVYLLVEPGDESHPQVIVEAQGSIMNNVLSGQQGGYRLGIQFGKFARDGKEILQKYLPKEIVQPPRIVAPAEPPPAPAEADGDAAEAAAPEDAPAAEEPAPAAEEDSAADESAGQA